MSGDKPKLDVVKGGTGTPVSVLWGASVTLNDLGITSINRAVAVIDDSLREHSNIKHIPAAHALFIPGAESCKTRQSKAALEDQLLALVDHQSLIVAVGGGALLDLVGFTASTLLRGVRLIYVPTTLLAMVDACYGGKNGVNTPLGKNLIGTLYDPSHIWCDQRWLQSLSADQLKQGLAEMIKHACIGRVDHLLRLSTSSCNDLALIRESLQVKFRVVQTSLQHPNHRHLLNLGHTVAHALEGYSAGAITHGSAVAIGLVVESAIAKRRGWISTPQFEQLVQLIGSCGLPIVAPCSAHDIVSWALKDKKNSDNKIFCSLPKGAWGQQSLELYTGPFAVSTAEITASWM